MAFSFRAATCRPFANWRDYDDGAAGTLQLGFTTYGEVEGGDQSYQTSYVEWGGRSDHLTDALLTATGNKPEVRLVSQANDTDREYVGSNERNGLTAASLQTVEVD